MCLCIFAKNEFMIFSLKSFRIISILEGVSFLVLLGIGMPLKYMAGIPEVVQVVGMAHGLLFIMYILAAIFIKQKLNWSMQTFLIVILCSIIPFGPFYAERKYLVVK